MRRARTAAALLLLAALGGTLAYAASARRAATLTVWASTAAVGSGRVLVERAEGGATAVVDFAIQDTGGQEFPFVVELPPGPLRSLRILTLAAPGAFAVRSLSLEVGPVAYDWEGPGSCTRQWRERGASRRVPCREGDPVAGAGGDGAVTITGVPAAGLERSAAARLALAAGTAVAVLLAGLWLLRPPLPGPTGWAARSLWLGVALLFARLVALVWQYGVDVPAMDEWDYFAWPGGIPESFSPGWLVSRHNEHRTIPTHLGMWLNLRLLGLDFAFQKLANLLLFGGLLAALALLKERVAGRGRFPLFPAFLLFLLSPIAYEIHLWALTNQFHLVLLSAVLALLPAFPERPTLRTESAFAALCALGAFSFSAGVVFAAVFVGCRAARLALAPASAPASAPAARRRETRLFAGSAALVAGALALWARGYTPKGDVAGAASLLDARFWDYFLNLVGLGFGATAPSPLPGLAALLGATLPLALLLARRETRWTNPTWRALSLTAGLLAVLAVIAYGRSDPTLVMDAKSSRFSVIAFLLIPASALSWWLAVRSPPLRRAALALFWCACAFGYRDDWSAGIYRALRQDDRATLACVERYFAGTGDGVCQGKSTPAALERARSLDVRFTRQFGAARR